MAFIVADRVQELTTTSGTGTLTLNGAVNGFQTFSSGIGNSNTTFYTIYDSVSYEWEVGIGTVGSGTLSRDTVLANSLGTTAKINLAGNAASVFCTYPAEKSVNLDASGNVTPLGTISSGTWQGSTVGVAYGGTGVTSSSGANSVMLRDSNQNVQVNRITQSRALTTAAGGTTALSVSSAFVQTLIGTGGQTFQLPDATTIPVGTWFLFDNDATGTLTVTDYGTTTVDTVAPGGYALLILEDASTVAGIWIRAGLIPHEVNWGTNNLDLGGSTTITNGAWQGDPVGSAYGGTGLTTFTAANYALYSTSASALTAGTLPVVAGGTGNTTYTDGQLLIGNSTGNTLTKSTLTAGTGISISNGGGSITITNTSPSSGGTVTSVAALTLGTTGTDLSSTVANSTTTPVITLNVPTASATNRGALSSTDWSTFNGKQTAYTNLTSIGSLANSAGWLYNNGSGTFSYSTPTKTDVGLGNVTNDAQTRAAIVPNTTPTAGQILVGNAGGTAYAPVSMSSDATLASTGALTLATVNTNVGSFTNASITVDGKGRITAASSGSSGVTTFSAGTTGFTPSTATSGAVTLAGTLSTGNGGTGLTTFTAANNAIYSTSASALTAGTLPILAGGTGSTTASGARTNLGATTVGSNFFTLTNPTAVTFPRINADNTVSTLDAATFRTAIGAGTGNGTVTSITAGTGLSGGTITTTGTIALANTAVTAGSYTNANITVDAQGRLTAASSGTGGTGTVTSVAAGNGMSFTTITTTGTVTMGTPSSISNTSTNSVSAGTHTHALSGELVESGTGTAPYYGARAWVNFTGAGAATLAASGNVSSVGRSATGSYTVNLTTAMSDTNAAIADSYSNSGVGNVDQMWAFWNSTSQIGIATSLAGTASRDCSFLYLAVYR